MAYNTHRLRYIHENKDRQAYTLEYIYTTYTEYMC